MEKIISITEKTFNTGQYREYDGYEIITDDQIIFFGIQNHQSCCESWGYMITNDDISEFIGQELIRITEVDSALNGKVIEEATYLNSGDIMFVNFETSNGVLQFVAYNGHNGYYGHDAVLVSKELKLNYTL